MPKKLFFATAILFAYQVLAVALLYTSDYLNVISYYTYPPSKGNIEFRRLPVLFGDSIAIEILKAKKSEAKELVEAGEVGMAAVLSSYEHNNVLTKVDAKYRAFKVAELFVIAGYDMSRCEQDGRSTASVLQEWGIFDSEIESFLRQFVKDGDLFSCRLNVKRQK